MSNLAEEIINRHEAKKAADLNWREEWDDTANYCMPHKGNITTISSAGEEQTDDVHDSTAEESLMIFAAGMLSQLTPVGELWFRYESSNEEASAELQAWFTDCTERAAKAIYSSNFYLAIHEDFLDAGMVGTSNTYLEQGEKRLLNFINIPIGGYTISENAEGMVDTVYREWEWTARQAQQKWGDDAMPKAISEALNSGDVKDVDKKFNFIHAVYPRAKGEWREGLVEGSLRPVASIYVCVEDKCIIEEGGFYDMPYAVSRTMRSRNEVWGRGFGTQVKPEVKSLNLMERDLLIATEKQVRPSWLLPDDSAYVPDNRPDGLTYYDATNPNGKPERVKEEGRLDWGEQKTDQKRRRIRSAFFADMFQMLSNAEEQKREKTAFEVSQMVQEKLVLFSPVFARMVQEKLNPLLERVFNVMMREGMFKQPPVDIADDQGYEIAYVSKIALAIKAAQNNALMEMIEMTNAIIPFDQSVAMVTDWRKAYREFAKNRGMSNEWQRTDKEIDQMMEEMRKAQAAQQAAELAKTGSEAAKNLGADAQAQATEAMAAS